MRGIEAVFIAAGTLALVVTRPRGLNEGAAALIGAASVLALGLLALPQVARLELASWNVFLFFLGMMALAALADQSGVFDRLAYLAAQLAHGRVWLLYGAVLLLGTVIALFFANDSAALVLTPIVYALVVRLSLDPFPFVFGVTFIADTASVGLPVSNPLNVIVGDSFKFSLTSYLSHLWLPALAVILVNIGFLFLLFHGSLTGRYGTVMEPSRASGSVAFWLLGATAIAYLLASSRRFPLGIIAVSAALLVALSLAAERRLDVKRLAREIGWPIFGFIAGMLVVVQALHASGITPALGRALIELAGANKLGTIALATLGAALGSNLVNNLPMALIMVSTIKVAHASAATRQALVYGTILGCDLGPNLTHLGSLATFIWLFFLRRKGLDVSAWDYFRVGIAVTPALLVAAIVGLWLTSR